MNFIVLVFRDGEIWRVGFGEWVRVLGYNFVCSLFLISWLLMSLNFKMS